MTEQNETAGTMTEDPTAIYTQYVEEFFLEDGDCLPIEGFDRYEEKFGITVEKLKEAIIITMATDKLEGREPDELAALLVQDIDEYIQLREIKAAKEAKKLAKKSTK